MKSKFILTIWLLAACSYISINAQVTIGSAVKPDENALLDLKEEQSGNSTKGILMPRVSLEETRLPNPMGAHREGMVVYNINEVADVTPGYYYNNGEKWLKLFTQEKFFFYMPSILLSTDRAQANAAGEFSVDLWLKYKEQFEDDYISSSPSDPLVKLPVWQNNELYYFVTYYDKNVFTDVKISNVGILTYKLQDTANITVETYMNIVLKVK